MSVILAPMATEKPADDPPTITVRVTRETARLLRTLAAWCDQSAAEWCTEHLDPILNGMMDRMQEERRKRK